MASALEVSAQLSSLYMPQLTQFGIELAPRGAVLVGAADNDACRGSAWALPVSDTCLVVYHDVTPRDDFLLYEEPSLPYACVCTASQAAADSMPGCGIDDPRRLSPTGPWPADAIYSFSQRQVGGIHARLLGGNSYRSCSICLLEGFFTELSERYPGEPFVFFSSFSDPWDNEASIAIRTALRRISTRSLTAPGAHLYARATVETLMAELAAARAEGRRAQMAAGSRANTTLAEEAATVIERSLDAGHASDIEELASLLYVSRSRLCAVFKRETGESIGAYARRRRIERACELLAEGRDVAQVAAATGYRSQAAFSDAFRKATGSSPSAWRAGREGGSR